MNQLENCQARYRSNTWMGRTHTNGPDEFEPTKFDCIMNIFINTVKTLYSDILYNSTILYNVNCICTNVPVKLKFEFITTEIQSNVKLCLDKQCRCKEF